MNYKNQTSGLMQRPFFFDSFLLKDHVESPARHTTQGQLPAVNISATEHLFLVELAAPGLVKENIKVEFNKDVLSISYQEAELKEAQKPAYLKKEFSRNSFSRRFSFPKNAVNEEAIEAQYIDGVLRLELPKKEEAKPKAARQISIG